MTAETSTISRRRVLSGAATAGLGLPLLAACGDDGGGSRGADPTSSATAPSSGATSTSDAPGKTKTSASGPREAGIATSEVPVGGGIVLADEQVVITQPSEGEFHAFTSICTHASCPVARVTTQIECDCHNSRFSIEDGSVVGGPALAPLPRVDFAAKGDRITLS